MPEWLQLALAAAGGGASTGVFQWLRQRTSSSARLQEHWTDTTLKLVETIQEQLTKALGELEPLRPVKAHLEEALDHLHALLASRKSENAEELIAAERRAQAFLRRMRPPPEDAVGEARQEVQRTVSARRLERDIGENLLD